MGAARSLLVLALVLGFALSLFIDEGQAGTLTPNPEDGAGSNSTARMGSSSSQGKEAWDSKKSELAETSHAIQRDSGVFPFSKGFPPKSLLVGVITAPNHFKARVAMRNVWKQYQMSRLVSKSDWEGMALRFFIGNIAPNREDHLSLEQKLVEEQSMYMDIVRLDSFNEDYLNLTAKTLAMVQWVKENEYASVLKIDDDSFLRLDNLVQFLKAEMRPEFIYAGTFVSGNVVNSNPQSKWYNRDLYDHDSYPDYASGPCYFLGGRVIDYIYDNRASFVKYRVEDAAIGIWTQNMINIDRVNLASNLYSHSCVDSQDIVYVNPVNADEMETLIQNVMMGDMCAGGFEVAECKTYPCLCSPPPGDCEFMNTKGWGEFSNEQYVDLIPRLIQTDKSVSGVSTVRRPASMK